MIATLTKDTELGFVSRERLHSLLHKHPSLRGLLISILEEVRRNTYNGSELVRREDSVPTSVTKITATKNGEACNQSWRNKK